MNVGRSGQTATVLHSGQVLVAGGHTATSELYNPATGTWTQKGNMSTVRSYAAAALLPNGDVLVAGGYDGSFNYLSSAELYDPNTGQWKATGSMAAQRAYFNAIALSNGTVLVLGGGDGQEALASAELYDPNSGQWTQTGSMTFARQDDPAVRLQNGKVLVVDGYGGSPGTGEVYDPSSHQWTLTGNMIADRLGAKATLLQDGRVLVTGGGSYAANGPIASAEIYDPATNSWSATTSMAQARENQLAALLPNGDVLVAGGIGILPDGTDGPISTAEVYDPGNATWSDAGSMSAQHSEGTATLLTSGEVLVAGGGGATASAEMSAELYSLTPKITDSTGNWAGYVASGTTFNSVSAEWTIPQMTCMPNYYHGIRYLDWLGNLKLNVGDAIEGFLSRLTGEGLYPENQGSVAFTWVGLGGDQAVQPNSRLEQAVISAICPKYTSASTAPVISAEYWIVAPNSSLQSSNDLTKYSHCNNGTPGQLPIDHVHYLHCPMTITVKEGDTVTATVSYQQSRSHSDQGVYTFALRNDSNGHVITMQYIARNSAVDRASAEWILEGTPLSKFDSVSFENALANGNPIIDAPNIIRDTMVNGNTVEAQPGAIGSDGASFSIGWMNY